MERQVQLEQVIQAALDSLRASVYHQWGGNVVQFHAATQTADVQPNPSDPRTNPDTGQPYAEPWPVILNVPVAFLRCGGFVAAGPLKPNDPVVLLAFDVDPTTWMKQGRSTQPVAPADIGRSRGAYWIALPCDPTSAIQDASAAAAGGVVGLDGNSAQIRFAPGSIQLGNAGGDHVALAAKIDSLVNVLLATYTPSGTETGFAALLAALVSWKASNWTTTPTTGSSLIKAQ